MSERELVAYNFKRLRELKEWEPKDAAQKGNTDVSYISQVERLHCNFGRTARKKWAAIFGVDVTEFYVVPTAYNEKDQELALLKEEAGEYGPDQIRRVREVMHAMFGQETSATDEAEKARQTIADIIGTPPALDKHQKKKAG